MTIFNHQAFTRKFRDFSLKSGMFLCDAPRVCLMLTIQVFAGSAQKRRFIKPNKTESPKRDKKRIPIGAAG